MPSSCIKKIASEENYRILMEKLKEDPGKNNKFFYESEEPCILPTGKSRGSISDKNTVTSGGTGGNLVGSTGTKPGGILFG